MNLEELMAKGLTKEQAEAVIAMHKTAIDGNYVAKHRFDEVNGEVKNLKDAVKERDTQISGLKKFEGDNAALQTQIKDLETANTKKDDEYKAQLSLERKKNVVKMALLEDAAGKPHDADMVLGLFNLDQISIDDNGKIASGFKEQHENIKKEKAFLFSAKPDGGTPGDDGKGGAGWKPAGTPPNDGSGGAPKPDASVSYGKSLAQIKMGMMGIKPTSTETK